MMYIIKKIQRTPAKIIHRVIRPSVHALCLAPFLILIYRITTQNIGINPVEFMTHESGTWSLRLLLACLAISPIIKFTQIHWAGSFTTPFGSLCFFICTHPFCCLSCIRPKLVIAIPRRRPPKTPIYGGRVYRLCLANSACRHLNK